MENIAFPNFRAEIKQKRKVVLVSTVIQNISYLLASKSY